MRKTKVRKIPIELDDALNQLQQNLEQWTGVDITKAAAARKAARAIQKDIEKRRRWLIY